MKLTLLNHIGNCPVCAQAMEHNEDVRQSGQHFAVYSCPSCEIGVTYISPDDDRKEYHEYKDGEIQVIFEPGY